MRELNWIVEGVAFVIMISLSLIVGLYYGCVQGKQNTVSEYLLGGKHMTVFPIAMSLVTSQISGITLLGNPSEVYSYGTQYLISAGNYVLCSFIIIYIYLPVFYELQATSVFEYLDLRFSSNVRKFSSIIYTVSVILHIPVVIYLPAMALGYVTDLNVHYITPIICAICIFYTTIGGLKTVVWTDAIQSVFTTASIIIVIVLGLIRVGGFDNMLRVNLESDRIELFRMDPDPFLRNTFWTVTIGMLFTTTAQMGIQAGSVQRFVALPTYEKARKSLILFSLGMCVIKSLTGMTGLLIYATYKDCDPSLANYIKSDKNIVTYFVADVASKIPGTTGLFISGVVSAALSTMSAQLNTLSGTIYEDLVVKTLNVRPSDLTASIIMKCTVVVLGVICMILVFAIEKLNGIIQLSISLGSVTTGAMLSVFTLGVCFPWANSRGAMCGMLTSIGIMTWIVFGAQMAMVNNELKYVKKNVSIAGCPDGLHFKNHSDFSGLYRMNEDVYVSPNVNKLFAVSYMHYSTIGTAIALVVGIVVSLVFPTEQNIDPKLLTPCIRNWMYPKDKTKTKCDANNTEEYQLVSQDTKL